MKLEANKYISKLTFRKNKQKYILKSSKYDSFEKQNIKTKKNKKKFKLPLKIAILLSAMTIGSCLYGKPTNSVSDFNDVNNQKQNCIIDNEEYNIDLDVFSDEYFIDYNQQKNFSEEILSKTEEDINKSKTLFSKSTIYTGKDISPELKEIINESDSLINGYIDKPVAQGATGDCWLIAGIENLSYIKNGAKHLHNSLSINKNGNIEVYLKGPNLRYEITPQEFQEANGKYTYLSHGDDDMLLFEIAVNKFREDVYNKKIEIDENLPDYFYYTSNIGYNYLTMGEIRQAYWLLTGATDSIVAHDDKKDIKQTLQLFSNDENGVLSASFDKDFEILDVENKKLKILAEHEYGIRNIDSKSITLINPYQNLREIIIPIEEFYNLPITDLIYCHIE